MALILYGTASFLLVGLYRHLALRFQWLDLPNERSSHRIITPRGAGLVFALLIAGALIGWLPLERAHLLLTVLLGVIALTGWLDDIRGISARVRFVVYIALAAASVYLVMSARTTSAHFELLLYVSIAAIALAWLINLYNFMDGINGLAALEAIFVLLGIAWFAQGSVYAHTFAQIHFFSGAALTGFLLWNFPAGKVFMGDAGSAFLGLFLGVLMLWSYQMHGPSPTIWLILLAAFIADATYTLLVRAITHQRLYAAHRLHAYQRLTDRLSASHAGTTGAIMAINICWLLPVAWLVHNDLIDDAPGLCLAYIPILTGCYCLKAGVPRQGEV